MNDKLFIEAYCHNCGTQRCEGIHSEWFEGCRYRWNHDSYDAATEIERLNRQIMEMARKMAGRKCNDEEELFTNVEEHCRNYLSKQIEAEWVPIEKLSTNWGVSIIHHYECSNCKIVEYTNNHKYCSNCGAKMIGRR